MKDTMEQTKMTKNKRAINMEKIDDWKTCKPKRCSTCAVRNACTNAIRSEGTGCAAGWKPVATDTNDEFKGCSICAVRGCFVCRDALRKNKEPVAKDEAVANLKERLQTIRGLAGMYIDLIGTDDECPWVRSMGAIHCQAEQALKGD